MATKEELQKQYQEAVVGASAEDTKIAYHQYLAAVYKLEGDSQVFHDLRHRARTAGAVIAADYMGGKKTAKAFYYEIQSECADVYRADMEAQGLVPKIDETGYKMLTEDLALKGMKVFDPKNADPQAVCVPLATIWHGFVDGFHALCKLPDVAQMKEGLQNESEEEVTVVEGNDFDVPMTDEEKDAYNAELAK